MRVELSGPLRAAADGLDALDIQAGTIRELLRKLVEQYPAMQAHMDDGIAVSINGTMYRDDWRIEIPDGAEVYLLPRIQGG